MEIMIGNDMVMISFPMGMTPILFSSITALFIISLSPL